MAIAPFQRDLRPGVLICTLGGTPRIVTFALDWLRRNRANEIDIRQVVVVYLASGQPRQNAAIQTLHKEIANYTNPEVRFDIEAVREMHPIQIGSESRMVKGSPISKKSDERFADAVWLTIHDLIYTKKREGMRIQLCLAGGPRLMSLQAFSAASLLFTNHDQCWHMYTPDELQAEAEKNNILHIADFDERFSGSAANFRLIDVPILPMGRMFPLLHAAALMTPAAIIEQHSNFITDEEQRKCRAVYAQLKPKQRLVLREFARGANSIQDVASRLNLSAAVISNHNTAIFAECRNVWFPNDPKFPLKFSFMHDKFGDLPDVFWDDLDHD